MSDHSIGSATSKVEYTEVNSVGGTIESTDDLVGRTGVEPTAISLDPQAALLLDRYCRKVDMRILAYAI
ncbi:hypothetical protein GGI16_000983, partial [Coemansia sp. S142-1]